MDGVSYGPAFGGGDQPDVVGCGVDHSDKVVFFTLNGRMLGVGHTQVECDQGLHGAAALHDDPEARIRFNLCGPWQWDLPGWLAAKAIPPADPANGLPVEVGEGVLPPEDYEALLEAVMGQALGPGAVPIGELDGEQLAAVQAAAAQILFGMNSEDESGESD